jgi:hypothetical protein
VVVVQHQLPEHLTQVVVAVERPAIQVQQVLPVVRVLCMFRMRAHKFLPVEPFQL